MGISSVSGTITVNGTPQVGVHVTASGGTNQYFGYFITDENGQFYSGGIPDNVTFVLTPSMPGITFTPEDRIITTDGTAMTGIDFEGTGTIAIGLLDPNAVIAQDFEIANDDDGLQKVADYLNYWCSSNGNASLAGTKISARHGVGAIHLTALITGSNRNWGYGAVGDFYFKQFEILNDGNATQKIAEWLGGFETIIDPNHYAIPQLVMMDTYYHANNVYLVLGIYRAVENSSANQGFPFGFTVDIFKGEFGAANLQARLQAKDPTHYYFGYDYAIYWSDWSTPSTSGSIIIGHNQ